MVPALRSEGIGKMSDPVIRAVTEALIINGLNWRMLALLLCACLLTAVCSYYARSAANNRWWRGLFTATLAISVLAAVAHVFMAACFCKFAADRASVLVEAARQDRLKIGEGEIYRDEKGKWRQLVRKDGQVDTLTFFVMDGGAGAPREVVMQTSVELAGEVVNAMAEAGGVVMSDGHFKCDPAPSPSATPTPSPNRGFTEYPPGYLDESGLEL
jgi:hypothetical protein